MRLDLINRITEQKDVTNAIILTHNIDFVFVQSLVLSAMRRCGQPTLTIFADAQCAEDAFAHQMPVLSSLGIRYRVVPVAMQPGFRFHPKAVLLSGSEKATLAIGSGNLTFGGWRENAEVWAWFDTEEDGTGPFNAFLSYLHQILGIVPLRESIQAEVDEAFDISSRGWAADMSPPSGVIGKFGNGEALLDRMLRTIGDDSVDSLSICAPYVDEDGEGLRKLIKQIRPSRTTALAQKGRSGLNRSVASAISGDVGIVPVGFGRDSANGVRRQSFIHAKFYAVEQGDRVTVFVGSANCSRAALTIPGPYGNAELLAVLAMTRTEFREQYIDELQILEGDPELPENIRESDGSDWRDVRIRILAARFDAGNLLIGYTSSPGITVTGCLVDREHRMIEMIDSGLAAVDLSRPPRHVILEGLVEEQAVRSNLIWVDHERELRSTSRGRTLAETIRVRVRGDQWSMGAWTEILEVFCKHLQYMPPRPSFGGRIRVQKKANKGKGGYSEADVFSDGYGLPLPPFPITRISRDMRIRSLQQMLLHWFGHSYHEEEDNDTLLDGPEEIEDDDSGGGTVDHPEVFRPPSQTPKPEEVSEKERDRARRVIEVVTQEMTNRDYLEKREPELLAADLKISSLLLRTGLVEGWMSSEDYFAVTHQIWSSLFFTSEVDSTVGWLEYRYRSADSPSEVISRMASAELSAALAAWAMAVPAEVQTIEQIRFALACVLSIARLPWLWNGGGGNENDIATQLGNVLRYCEKGDKPQGQPRNDWLNMIRRGHALRRLERALEGRTPAELRELINQDRINTGELLWQGESGFCVAKHSCLRSEGYRAIVLKLQGKGGESEFVARFLIPLRALLAETVTPSTDIFGDQQREVMFGFIDQLAKGVSQQEKESSQ